LAYAIFAFMRMVSAAFLIISFFYISCKQTQNKDGDETVKNDTTTFFQVGQYISSQIEEVSKTPFYIYKIETINGKTDSTAINQDMFRKLARGFLQPDVSDPGIKKNYKENIFHDQTTESYTISYSTTKPELEVQNLEVLLAEDGETVKRVFIRKFFNYKDSTAIEQLSWKSGENFRVNRLVQMPDKSEVERQTIVVWNEKS
jgi:hypothetical protein